MGRLGQLIRGRGGATEGDPRSDDAPGRDPCSLDELAWWYSGRRLVISCKCLHTYEFIGLANPRNLYGSQTL